MPCRRGNNGVSTHHASDSSPYHPAPASSSAGMRHQGCVSPAPWGTLRAAYSARITVAEAIAR